MSAIADAYVVSNADLTELIERAAPVRRFLRKPLDPYPAFLAARCTALEEFTHSGHVFGVLLAFLDEQGITLGEGHVDVAGRLQETRGLLLAAFITPAERELVLPRLKLLQPTAAELEAYASELNDRPATGEGEALVAGVDYLRQIVASVPDSGVVLLQVG